MKICKKLFDKNVSRQAQRKKAPRREEFEKVFLAMPHSEAYRQIGQERSGSPRRWLRCRQRRFDRHVDGEAVVVYAGYKG